MEEMFLTAKAAAKCHRSLSKLSRHFENPIVVTGSLAAAWHLLRKEKLRKKSAINDIDTVVEDLGCIRPSLSEDFLINHFHPSREKGRILLQLVDAENALRIDVFTPSSETLFKRLIDFKIGVAVCQAVSLEDILVKLLSIIYPVAKGSHVESKYVKKFYLLLDSANLEAAKLIWQDYRKINQPIDFSEAVGIIEKTIAANPHLLKTEEFRRDLDFECQWCVKSETFPLSPRPKIYEILGYV